MFKNALISVSDKTGLEDFLKPFVNNGLQIVSSGGTAQYLESCGFKVTKVSEQTGFPEVMGGRVKTLHPNIHMPILQRANVKEDQEILKEYGLKPFDLVVVNLYPFEESLKKNLGFKEMIENIDIGGPTLLRAAAKNFESICVVCDPKDYDWISTKKELTEKDRKKLSAKVFGHVANYDSLICNYLSEDQSDFNLKGTQGKELRYGENPQQKACWYQTSEQGLHQAEILQGKELSYNNLLDIEAALQTLLLFDKPTAVSVKHNNPCGVAQSTNLIEALKQSLNADPMSVFGGIVALNRTLDKDCAQTLSKLFLECIIAPQITEEAKNILAEKKNLRVLIWQEMLNLDPLKMQSIKSISGGLLVQSTDQILMDRNSWEVVSGELEPTDWQGLEFSWKVCSMLKSNAIAVTSSHQSLGLGMGQVNRVDAVKQAFARAKEFHPQNKDLYLASDAFFPFPDSIELAAQYDVKAIIQPGGSVKDKAVIEKAKELNIKMVFTGRRHFRH
jgi:phosphoribosylaminoimidazolecarboxamide formyltransferase / IMP cyclohydrolase